MSGRARVTLFAMLASLLTSWSLASLVDSAGWLLQAAVLLAVQSGVGAGARRLPLGRTLTVASQVLVSLLVLMFLFAGKGESTGTGPMAYLVTDFGALFRRGVQDVGEFAIPAPLTDGIRLLLLAGVLLIGLLVDLLAVTLRTAAAAGLPLLALYSVAAGLSGGAGASAVSFLLAGCGYLLLLLAEGRDRLAQWGRVFGAAPSGRCRRPRGTGAAARARARRWRPYARGGGSARWRSGSRWRCRRRCRRSAAGCWARRARPRAAARASAGRSRRSTRWSPCRAA